ncbi:MAG: ABC transporter ATP-binding protein [Fibrobacterota bacterium]
MAGPAVKVEALTRHFGEVIALNGVSLEIPIHTLYGIIGADGAGKSTLFDILATLLTPDTGRAVVLGLDATLNPAALRSHIGFMPQKFSLYEDLSVKENLLFFADIFGVERHERDKRLKRLLEFSRLAPFQERRVRFLSGGMKQKLALSCALIHTPELLILDEPTTGVDPVSRKEFWDLLRELKEGGMTLLVSTPYMEEAEYCDRLALLHQGRVLMEGTPAGLLSAYPAAKRMQDLFFLALSS